MRMQNNYVIYIFCIPYNVMLIIFIDKHEADKWCSDNFIIVSSNKCSQIIMPIIILNQNLSDIPIVTVRALCKVSIHILFTCTL